MSGLLEEEQQVIRPQPHGGAVGHGVEVDHLVASLHQVPVQDELHAAVLIEEQSKSRRAALPHLTGDRKTRVTSGRSVLHISHRLPFSNLQQQVDEALW